MTKIKFEQIGTMLFRDKKQIGTCINGIVEYAEGMEKYRVPVGKWLKSQKATNAGPYDEETDDEEETNPMEDNVVKSPASLEERLVNDKPYCDPVLGWIRG